MKLQRKAGSKWTTVKAVKISGTKYVTTFNPRNGQTFRISFGGNTVLKPGVSFSHKIAKRGKYEC